MELYNKKGEVVGFVEAIEWWLEKYEGLEHLCNLPETMYSINTILKRCFDRIMNLKLENKEIKPEIVIEY